MLRLESSAITRIIKYRNFLSKFVSTAIKLIEKDVVPKAGAYLREPERHSRQDKREAFSTKLEDQREPEKRTAIASPVHH